VPHTLVLDRGRVTAASPSSLTIHEADGSSVQVALAPDTQYIVNGHPGQVTDVRRGAMATTQRIDGGPARLVTLPIPSPLLRLPRRWQMVKALFTFTLGLLGGYFASAWWWGAA